MRQSIKKPSHLVGLALMLNLRMMPRHSSFHSAAFSVRVLSVVRSQRSTLPLSCPYLSGTRALEVCRVPRSISSDAVSWRLRLEVELITQLQ